MEKKTTEQVIADIKTAKETYWNNDKLLPFEEAEPMLKYHTDDIEDARTRLERFAPLIMRLFPETEDAKGLIESPLKEIENTRKALGTVDGKLLLKCDSHLPIAGSVKARGGIYEVLKHTEDLALTAGLLTSESGPDEYRALADHKDFFGQYKVQVGSTGNLGMSIGIMSAAIGYQAIVHMSADAKEWKKKHLRAHGVKVYEYDDDYSKAVAEGRKSSDADPSSYFVDDESSSALYLGYAVAGKRIQKQLCDMGIKVDKEHKLAVYIPCGVGGAPSGISFGLKECFGDDVLIFFVEPVQSPCMMIGLATETGNKYSVKDFGLTGKTDADGLACGRCSALAAGEMNHLISGISTIEDEPLYAFMKLLNSEDDIVIEPSSCAAFRGLEAFKEYLAEDFSFEELKNMTHICWATGGSLMPKEVVEDFLSR